VLGTPTKKDVQSMNSDYKHQDFPDVSVLPFETHFPPGTSAQALDFLRHLFVYDP
jgi:hypothetical protein